MRIKEDYRGLSGQEKVAMLLLSLPEDQVSQLFSNMDDDEIREISQSMANLGTVSAELVERLYMEFADRIASTGQLIGSVQTTERLLARVMPRERAATIMEEIRGPAGRTMWDKLSNVNETVLANYLKNEYPQTVAVVLTKVKSEHAARVLGVLPEPFALEVVTRMLRMEAVQKEILEDVERTLRHEFMNNLARTSRRDSHEMMAEIFNNFDRATEHRMMAALETRNQESATRIKSLMFTFEDLARLDPGSVQTLLRNIDKGKLALALKGGSEALRSLFFSNMSERAGRILREDMDALGPVRLREVDEAQQLLVATAKDLATAGELRISDNKGDDELIY